jgi:hypothetical protein
MEDKEKRKKDEMDEELENNEIYEEFEIKLDPEELERLERERLEVLKELILKSSLIEKLTGKKVDKVIKVDFSEAEEIKPELVLNINGRFYHIELLMKNEEGVIWHMMGRLAPILALSPKEVYPIGIYIGDDEELKIRTSVSEPNFKYSFELIDLKKINCEDEKTLDENKILSFLCKEIEYNGEKFRYIDKLLKLPVEKRKKRLKEILTLEYSDKIVNVPSW